MSRPAKSRKCGLTRNHHPYAPLHPKAQDSRGTSSSRIEPEVNDLPQSSSDEETDTNKPANDAQARSSTVTVRRPSAIHSFSVEGGYVVDALGSTTKKRQKNRIYGKSQPTGFVNIHSTSTVERPSYSTSANREKAKGGKTGLAVESRSVKFNTSTAAKVVGPKRFQDPPSMFIKPRRKFRAPDITKHEDLPTPRATTSKAPSRPKAKAVFKAPKQLGKAARLLLEDHDTDFQHLTTRSPTKLSQSSRISSPISSSSASPIRSSGTSISLAQDTLDRQLAIAEADNEPENVCPICKGPVDEEQLSELRTSLASQRDKHRKIVSQQTEFCRMHREADARQEWQSHGYPEIDWSSLPARLELHRAAMNELLQGSRRSWFRERLQARLDAHRGQSTRARDTLLQQLPSEMDSVEDVGYYGGKGAAVCMHFIASAFAPRLQKLRTEEPLIVACGGVAAYEQLVLLPELCSLLVAEDRRAAVEAKTSKKEGRRKDAGDLPSEEELEAARETLRASAELGHLLCEEENEDILSTDSEDGAGKNLV